MQKTFVDEVVNRPARLEGRVELHHGLRPEKAFRELAIDALADSIIADDDEASRVVGEVIHEALTEFEDVHLP
jgi:hypothetical protein